MSAPLRAVLPTVVPVLEFVALPDAELEVAATELAGPAPVGTTAAAFAFAGRSGGVDTAGPAPVGTTATAFAFAGGAGGVDTAGATAFVGFPPFAPNRNQPVCHPTATVITAAPSAPIAHEPDLRPGCAHATVRGAIAVPDMR